MTIDEAIDYLDCGTCGTLCESCTGNRKHGGKCDVEKNLREAVDMAIVALRDQQDAEFAAQEKRYAAIMAGDEYGDLDSHDERHIVEECIALMQWVVDSVQEWLEWLDFDFQSLDAESKFQLEISYMKIVQMLLLWHTSHSGGTSTRAKCKLLGLDSSEPVIFKFDEESEV
jgi:hypothetical protein